MTQFDDIFVPLAEQLIDATFGFDVTHRRVARTYDAATGKNVERNTDTTVKVTPPSPYSNHQIDGTIIQIGDQWIMMSSAAAIVPTLTDFFIISGGTWQVVRVEPIVSGEQTPAYRIQLRQ